MNRDQSNGNLEPASSLQCQAEHVLEWETVLTTLASQAHSALGAEKCRTLPLESTLEAASERQQATTEMLTVLQGPVSFPPLIFEDVREVLSRTVKGALLEGPELRDISSLIGLGQDAKRCLQTYRSQIDTVWKLAEPLNEQVWVKQGIDQCIDQEGHIRESATPELYQLIQHTQEARRHIRHRLEAILASTRYEDMLQGHYFAERENRYVIPVKTERQHEIPGIVHDISTSGATVFLEPKELIELNNSIKVGDLHVAKEVRRILQELSTMVAEHAETLTCNIEILATLDCLSAKARLSLSMNGHPISLNDQKRIHLREARHPLLILNKDEVVPNDLTMDSQTLILVISGPNTGGKTVTLKMIGLVALMVRAGLHPPCAEGSEMAIFPRVYADIGDAQDLTKALSSFSGHISHMIQLFKEMDNLQATSLPDSLVLLDEIGSSTDPIEGAALAEALLGRLYDVGCKVVVTTHYHALKTLALKKSGFLNASQEFNIQTLSPTFRLLVGLPGGSSALDIASRLGLDAAILTQAASLVKGQDQDLEQVFQELQIAQQQLDQEIEDARKLRREADDLFCQAQATEERLRTTERDERQKIRRNLHQEFSKAKLLIHDTIKELKLDKTLIKAKTAQQRVLAIQDESIDLLTPSDAQPLSLLTEGDHVELKNLGTTGVLLEAPQGKKRVRVQVGDKAISVDASLLSGLAQVRQATKETPVSSSVKKTRSTSSSLIHPAPETANQSFLATMSHDLRGKSMEEAQEEMIATLDRAMLDGTMTLRLIHGHGSGKLKSLVREYLADSPYVSQFRQGEREEGGDGVTIVELR